MRGIPRWRGLKHIAAAADIDFADGNTFRDILKVFLTLIFCSGLVKQTVVYSPLYCTTASPQLPPYSLCSDLCSATSFCWITACSRRSSRNI